MMKMDKNRRKLALFFTIFLFIISNILIKTILLKYNESERITEYSDMRKITEKEKVEERIKIANLIFSNKELSKDAVIKIVEENMKVKIKDPNFKFRITQKYNTYLNSEKTYIWCYNAYQQNVLYHINNENLRIWTLGIMERYKAKTPKEVVLGITDYLSRSIIYPNKNYFDNRTNSYEIGFGLKRKTGVCWDYSRYAVEFARSIGIPARVIAIISPRDGGHAICEFYIGGKWIITDPTNRPKKYWTKIDNYISYISDNKYENKLKIVKETGL